MAWWKKFITGNRTTSIPRHDSDQLDSDNELANRNGGDSGRRNVNWSNNASEMFGQNSDERRSRSMTGSRNSVSSRCDSESECVHELVVDESQTPSAEMTEFIAKCLPVAFWCVATCVFLLLGMLMLLVFSLAINVTDDNVQWVRAGRSGSNIVLGFGILFFVLMFCTAVYIRYCRNVKMIREGVERRAAPRTLRAAREHRLTPHPLLFQRTALSAHAHAHMELLQLEAGLGAGPGAGAEAGAGAAVDGAPPPSYEMARDPASAPPPAYSAAVRAAGASPPAAPKTYVRPWMPPPRAAPARSAAPPPPPPTVPSPASASASAPASPLLAARVSDRFRYASLRLPELPNGARRVPLPPMPLAPPPHVLLPPTPPPQGPARSAQGRR